MSNLQALDSNDLIELGHPGICPDAFLGRIGRRHSVIRFRKPTLLVIPAVAAAIAVVVSVLPASSASTTASAPRMSAVELANGLLFNQGPAAHYLTALGRPSIQLSGKPLAVERFVDRALRAHPALAAAFVRDVQSGNRVKVDIALTSLGTLTKAALDREYGAAAARRVVANAGKALSSPGQMAPDDSSGGNGNDSVSVYFYVYAAVFLVVVLVDIIDAPNGPSSASALAKERVVNLVAISLHAGR
jgi:hypothetical protein